jgi:electron transfer flavoprotein beta subunit
VISVKIVACIKQVPDTEASIKVKPDGSGIDEDGIKWIMNPYDEFGLEEALKLQEANGGEVTVVSLGPVRVMETIRTALAMGAERGIHITIDGADAYNTAVALAAAIKEINPDIVFCGQRAIDDDSGQVGSILAELLGIPQVTIVTGLEVADDKVTAVKQIEGAQLVIESAMPCVVTAHKGLNEPRYTSLPGIMKAKKKRVDVKDAAALGIFVEPKAKIIKMTPPPERASGKIIDGDDPVVKAAELVKLLREEAKVI